MNINENIFKVFPVLESERLVYREIGPTDASDLYRVRTNDEVMRFMDSTRLTSLDAAEKLILKLAESFTDGKGISWGIVEKESRRFIGYFGFWRIIAEHCRAEIGFALDPDFWGRGYMTETIRTLASFGFSGMNLHSIEANVNPGNRKSLKLLQEIGFKKEAYFRENMQFNGRFIDSIILSLLESDLSDSHGKTP